jgi:hypothetical protein
MSDAKTQGRVLSGVWLWFGPDISLRNVIDEV